MTIEAEKVIGLFPGAPSPSNDAEVDALLRMVPSFVFAEEFEECLFGAEVFVSTEIASPAGQLATLVDSAYVARVRSTLAAVRERADREFDGGTLFLATVFGHFLDQVVPTEHPAIIALYCRSVARHTREEESPRAVASLMDEYDAAVTRRPQTP